MYWRVYTGEDGYSHFEEIKLPEEDLFQYALKAGEAMDFRRVNMDGWHNPPRRQWVIHLEGAAEIGISDGTTKILRPGDMVVMEEMCNILVCEIYGSSDHVWAVLAAWCLLGLYTKHLFYVYS